MHSNAKGAAKLFLEEVKYVNFTSNLHIILKFAYLRVFFDNIKKI
jgi:hypothetical protein